RGEHRLDATPGLQAVFGAPIDRQIEFSVSAAPIELKAPFAFAARHVHAALENRQVRGQKVISHRPHECNAPRESATRPVVEEDSTDTARLVAMRQEEIAVACLFQLW